MANTYTQIHIQAVFAVKRRRAMIRREWKDELYQYITGIVQSYRHKMLAINGMPDHIHIFFGMRPTQSLSDLMQDIKSGSSKWINDHRLTVEHFEWQEGYGAFSYSRTQVSRVINYVLNQETHHSQQSFMSEYLDMLKKFEVPHDERYIFIEPI